ncbi:flavo protein [Kockovaella imperatae]|uniref:Flavo protein n=1 Tax=Kockovaella imperatae TaxID=4999 RepID=A0A1Y1UF40_9TREE|nr:flavo protein [Kockovaella imperatae]ORX36609.1 flavo protein [Kockovaella imperatae]
MQATYSAPAGRAGPSRLNHTARLPRTARKPFVCADHKPQRPDGRFRVVIISSGSVASVKIPDIVGSLSRNHNIDLQIVATKASLHFYNQAKVDEAVRRVLGPGSQSVTDNPTLADDSTGVRVWTDEDEWSDWNQLGDPILHIELRRWADLVLVAPCSADMLAKIAGGLCDNLATSLLRALSPDTQTILFPAMNTHMYSHPLTANHLNLIQEKLGYMVSGPQGGGKLACGDEGPGKMTDWRDIVTIVEDLAVMHRAKFAEARVFRELGPGTHPNPNITYGITSDSVQARRPPLLDPEKVADFEGRSAFRWNGNQPGLGKTQDDPSSSRYLPINVEKTTEAKMDRATAVRTNHLSKLDAMQVDVPSKHPSADETSSSQSAMMLPWLRDYIVEKQTNNTAGSRLERKTEEIMDSRFAPLRTHAHQHDSALAWNGDQAGLSIERNGPLEFTEPYRMAPIPPIDPEETTRLK